ncbi:hypothetical protein [Escherichia sp. 20412-1]|uniref:hypothetical protein n=1 Tax=Escherichia sp. 20412-1 TaxID=2137853 RepID=UPI000D1580EE|nr:hypothetical protein [Escherichia sp. 20412-1]PSY65371.1 hypothetical protein C7B16_11710 [Escherichia sp. 20412-1]
MNKNLIAQMVAGALLLSASAASMAATTVDAHSQRVGATVVSGTCSITWPTDVTFSLSSADTAVAHNSMIGEAQSAGSITLTNCPANTPMKWSLQAQARAQGNDYQGLFTDESGKQVTNIAYMMGKTGDLKSQAWSLNSINSNLGVTDANGSLTVPVYIGLIKRGTSSVVPGALNSTVAYTVSYN